MDVKTDHLAVGGFVLAVLVALLAFVYWMEVLAHGGGSRRYDVVFDGSVQGLNEASGVFFNGLRVGAVKSLRIVPEDTRKVRAVIVVAGDIPIRENSFARVSPQSLAGLAGLEISPGTMDSPLLAAREGQDYPVIRADTVGAQTGGGMPEALGNANALFVRLNEIVAGNAELAQKTMRHVEAFTAMLDANKDDIAATIKDARALSARLDETANKLDAAVSQFSTALTQGDGSAVAQAQQAAQSIRKLADKLEKTVGGQAEDLTRQAQRSMKEFELFMKDGRRVADNLDRVLQKVEANPSSLLFGGSQVPEYKPGQQPGQQ